MSIDALASLSPQARARLISLDAHNMISASLWRAALASSPGGEEAGRIENFGGTASLAAGLHLAAMGVLPGPEQRVPSLQSFPYPPPVSPAAAAPAQASGDYTETDTSIRATPRHAHSSSFESASRRSGVPAASLAAIIDAEAAKTKDGNWDPHSRNPLSSAAGLGQFLKGTWVALAEKPGSWLNETASQRGWLNAAGRVRSAARSELLSLRFDANASIQSVADLARQNLAGLQRAGIRIGTDVESVSRAAYIGHHLGLGDAIGFLGGGISPRRAKRLLAAQIGSEAANKQIVSSGGPVQAHREWLSGYLDKRIRPDLDA